MGLEQLKSKIEEQQGVYHALKKDICIGVEYLKAAGNYGPAIEVL